MSIAIEEAIVHVTPAGEQQPIQLSEDSGSVLDWKFDRDKQRHPT
jgi:hypothetical protein